MEKIATRTEAIRSFAAVVYDPADIVEVRCLPSRASRWFNAGELEWHPWMEGQNVYAGANPRKAVGGKDAESVALARCLFVDIDNVTIDAGLERWAASGLPAPSLTVASGGGLHLWWRLREAIRDMAEWTARQKALIGLLNSDKSIHDPPRILRMPGTVNQKRGVEAVIVDASGLTYGADEVVKAEVPTTQYTVHATEQRPQSTAARVAGLDLSGGLTKPNPGGFAGLSRATLLFLHAGAAEGERNVKLFAAACDYAGCRLPQSQAESDLIDAGGRCGLPDAEVLAAVRSAYGKGRGPAKPTVREAATDVVRKLTTPVEGTTNGATSRRAERDEEEIVEESVEPPNAARHGLSNVRDDWKEIELGNGKTKTVHILLYKRIDSIAAEILHAAGHWPKLLGGVPFVLNGEGLDAKPYLMARTDGLFGWLHGEMDLRWTVAACQDEATGDARTPPTKAELIEYLKCGRGGIESYRACTPYPHVPPMHGVYYVPVVLPPATGEKLAEFLAMLNPETEEDRGLMLAAMLTAGWGGECGTRPMFVLTAQSGVGSGKTSTAVAMADIWGGACALDYQESWADLTKSMFSSDKWNSRVLLFDNVKGKFGGSSLEAVVSATSISGWRAYVGTISRPNDAAIYVTFNMPSLTRDMAERAVVIKVGKPKHDKSFVAQSRAFIAANREQLIADLLAILKRPPVCQIAPEHGDRWQHWQREILGRIEGGDRLAALVCSRRPEVDSDADDALGLAMALVGAADRRTGEITAYGIHAAAVANGLWKDEISKPLDKNVQTCLRWARQVLSGRGVLEPVEGAENRPKRRAVLDDQGNTIARSPVFRVDAAAAAALNTDEDDGIPI